jgi:hypothetical protein
MKTYCGLVGEYQRFRGTYCLHLRDWMSQAGKVYKKSFVSLKFVKEGGASTLNCTQQDANNKGEICHCHYSISGYPATNCRTLTRFLNVNYIIRHERASSPLFQRVVSILWLLVVFDVDIWNVAKYIKEAVYDWLFVGLNVSLDVSFNNMKGWKGIREKAEEVNSTKAYITNWCDFPLNSQQALQLCNIYIQFLYNLPSNLARFSSEDGGSICLRNVAATYRTTRCHTSKDHSIYFRRCENFKSSALLFARRWEALSVQSARARCNLITKDDAQYHLQSGWEVGGREAQCHSGAAVQEEWLRGCVHSSSWSMTFI